PVWLELQVSGSSRQDDADHSRGGPVGRSKGQRGGKPGGTRHTAHDNLTGSVRILEAGKGGMAHRFDADDLGVVCDILRRLLIRSIYRQEKQIVRGYAERPVDP